MARSAGFLRVLVLAAACGLSGSLRLTDDVHVGGRIMGQYMSWGALAGASIEFNVSVREPAMYFVWVLLSDDAQFVTGTVLTVDGGWTVK